MWSKIKILEKISEGGMGEIYLGYHRVLGAQYAVKKIRKDLSRNKDLKRFAREITILKSISHPNIARVVDYCTDEENLGYAMEYCPHGSIEDSLKKEKLSTDQALDIFWKISSAVETCHNNGPQIIHRDIKPSNILIGLDGEPKLSDFGLALNTETNSDRITTSNWISPGYSPPEQYNFFKECNTRSDIYSLGATLFTMLTKKHYESEKDLHVIGNRKVRYILEHMLKALNEERFQSISHYRKAWEFLSNDIEIGEFLSLRKTDKIAKLNSFLDYHCGMAGDILHLNAASYFLQAVIDSEPDQTIIEHAQQILKHIDEQGNQMAAEMEQDNPSY